MTMTTTAFILATLLAAVSAAGASVGVYSHLGTCLRVWPCLLKLATRSYTVVLHCHDYRTRKHTVTSATPLACRGTCPNMRGFSPPAYPLPQQVQHFPH